jgi:opacity protein-like surface antigen
VFSVTAGRYITPSIRMELGLDVRTAQKPLRGASQSYEGRVTGRYNYVDPTTGLATVGTGTNTYDVSRNEDSKISNHTFMINALYDFNRGGKFTPYVGAGVGLALHMLNRATSEVADCAYGTGPDDPIPGPGACRNLINGPSLNFASAKTDSATGLGLAAALMAGVSYNLSERTHLDVGYRMMWQGGKVAISAPSLNGVSVLNVGSRLDHEIRTGMRFDLW